MLLERGKARLPGLDRWQMELDCLPVSAEAVSILNGNISSVCALGIVSKRAASEGAAFLF